MLTVIAWWEILKLKSTLSISAATSDLSIILTHPLDSEGPFNIINVAKRYASLSTIPNPVSANKHSNATPNNPQIHQQQTITRMRDKTAVFKVGKNRQF